MRVSDMIARSCAVLSRVPLKFKGHSSAQLVYNDVYHHSSHIFSEK